jgi:hypothetical protein
LDIIGHEGNEHHERPWEWETEPKHLPEPYFLDESGGCQTPGIAFLSGRSSRSRMKAIPNADSEQSSQKDE